VGCSTHDAVQTSLTNSSNIGRRHQMWHLRRTEWLFCLSTWI
jgi:hypothetical protein